ncbi:unnamed protein product, partial [Symbiodinium necroappetens]
MTRRSLLKPFSTAPAASDASAPETLDDGIVGPPDDMANASSALADCSNRGDSLTHNDAHVCEVVSSEASSMPPDASAAPASQVLDRWLVGRHAKLEVLRDTLFAWPEDMLRSVASLPCVSAAEHAEYAEYLVTVLSSMSLSTSFSGVDSPSTALAMMGAAALKMQGREVTKDSVPKACNKFGIEWLPQSQQELRRHPFGPGCIFSDINAFWLPTIADKLDTISRERRIMTMLKDLVQTTVCTGRIAYCEKCSRNCKVSEADLHVGGTPCVDFSSRGQQDQLDGKTTTSLLAFVAMRREIQEPFFVQENVQSFPDEFLSSMLSDLYELQSCVLDPECTFGWPVARRRKYVVGRHKTKTVPWHMRLDDFIRAIGCDAKVAADGTVPPWDIFFVASGEELRSELLWAGNRPTSNAALESEEGDESDTFKNSLSAMEKRFLHGYEALCRDRCYSLGQDPRDFANYSTWGCMRTLIKNAGIIYSDVHRRWVTPCEAFIMQGFPIYPMLSHGVAMSSFSLDEVHVDDNKSGRKARSSSFGELADNSMADAERYKRAHEVLFGQSMEVAERFNSEQGICLLTKIFEVYQDGPRRTIKWFKEDGKYLRDLHNCFHGGLAPTWLESILGSKDVEEAWKRHAQRQGITTSSAAHYQKSYSEWVTENFSQRFKTFQIFDLAKRVMHYLSDLDCVNKFTEALGDHCDFQHEQLQTLPTMQNLHVLGKLILTLSAAYSLELLAEVPIIRDAPSGSGGDYDMPMPEWTLTKHVPGIVDRLRTEIGGASFAGKLFKPPASARAQASSDGTALDVSELLAPKKRKRATSKPKAKGKAAKNRATDEDAEDVDQLLADVDEGSGCTRRRWWIDDLLSALIHAA